MDYDVTAFVNGETPPFDDVLDDFQNVILANFKRRAKLKDKTSRSLSFELDGIDFDLLPATNLARSQDDGSKISQKLNFNTGALHKYRACPRFCKK